MQLSNTVNDGLIETLNRITNATVNNYSFKAKVSDLNEALNWYCALAFNANRQWNFDDIGQTSPPIDTQDIVSGTNRYKVDSFTQKIINLIKLEILDSAGTGHYLVPETFESLGTLTIGNTSGQLSAYSGQTFQERYLNAPSGLPTNYIKNGDYIYLWPKPNYNFTAGLKAYFDRTLLQFTFTAFTMTIASPSVFTATAHGLVNADTVILETDGALPTGFAVDTQYFVVSSTANTFQLSLTSGGASINGTGSQSGNHAFLKLNASPGIVTLHHRALCRKAALMFFTYSNSFKIGNLPQQVQEDERIIEEFFSKRSRDMKKRMSVYQQENK